MEYTDYNNRTGCMKICNHKKKSKPVNTILGEFWSPPTKECVPGEVSLSCGAGHK